MMKYNYLYESVYYDIKKKIDSKILPVGAILENEFEMAQNYEVSRHTIRKALNLLESDGYIKRVSGHGTFVRKREETEYLLSNMKSYTEMLEDSNHHPRSIILQLEEIPVDEYLKKQLDTSEEFCYYVERLRLSNEEIMCIEKTYISKKHCPNIIEHVHDETSLFDLYENKYKKNIDSGLYYLKAINAPVEISKKLKIKEHDAVLNMVANIKLKNDEILYHVDAYYIGEKYNFTTILKRD